MEVLGGLWQAGAGWYSGPRAACSSSLVGERLLGWFVKVGGGHCCRRQVWRHRWVVLLVGWENAYV